jgi:hypothetical protein
MHRFLQFISIKWKRNKIFIYILICKLTKMWKCEQKWPLKSIVHKRRTDVYLLAWCWILE